MYLNNLPVSKNWEVVEEVDVSGVSVLYSTNMVQFLLPTYGSELRTDILSSELQAELRVEVSGQLALPFSLVTLKDSVE